MPLHGIALVEQVAHLLVHTDMCKTQNYAKFTQKDVANRSRSLLNTG